MESNITKIIDNIIDLADSQDLAKLDRKVLNCEDLAILEEEFKKDPNWNKDKQFEIGKVLNVPALKVYKWNWERKKK